MSTNTGLTIKGILKSVFGKFRQDPEKLQYLEIVVLVGLTIAFVIEILGWGRLSTPSIAGAVGGAIGANTLPVLVFYVVSWFDFLRRFNPLIYFLLLFWFYFAPALTPIT